MVEGRIAERRAAVRAARRRARLRRTLLVVVLAAVAVAAVVLERSEHAAVRDITVVGTERLAVADVVAASGVTPGDPILRLWPAAVEGRLVELPLVGSAEVSRTSLREVVITVEERRPVYVAVHRSDAVLVDRDGVVVAPGGDDRLPEVRLAVPPPRPGEVVASQAALANAHRVWTGLSGPLRARVVGMWAPDEDGLELELEDAPTVRFGRAERLEEKVRAMGAILDDVAGSAVTLIDVRVPDLPVVRID